MFNPKEYFKKTGYIYGKIRRWDETGKEIVCGIAYFNDYDEAQRWLHYNEKFGFDPEGYGKSLCSKSQAYGFIYFR